MKAALREKSTVGFSNMSFDELVMVNGGSGQKGFQSPYYVYAQGDGMPLYSGTSQAWSPAEKAQIGFTIMGAAAMVPGLAPVAAGVMGGVALAGGLIAGQYK